MQSEKEKTQNTSHDLVLSDKTLQSENSVPPLCKSTKRTHVTDDDDLQRKARRLTLLSPNSPPSHRSEENESLQNYVEIFNNNKLSKDNAWSVPLIDTLYSLVHNHHKSINFKFASSSLEASSRIYVLRVDSVYLDVQRLSAGLNAKKFVAANQDSNNDEDTKISASGTGKNCKKRMPKPKRAGPIRCLIASEKSTLNAPLNKVALPNPINAKWNNVRGAINATKGLWNNLLPSKESKLILDTSFPVFNAEDLSGDKDFTIEPTTFPENCELTDYPFRNVLKHSDKLQLRPINAGYSISDAAVLAAPDAGEKVSLMFDMNAKCVPLPPPNNQPTRLNIDFNDFDVLTSEDRAAISKCRRLLRAPIVIEDMRPVDSNSNLEYSYHPQDKVSQFWTGPSHWKFKRSSSQATLHGMNNQREKRVIRRPKKRRSNLLRFSQDFPDDDFLSEGELKLRKVNFYKWDEDKLKLPEYFQVSSNMFNEFQYVSSALLKTRPVPAVYDEHHEHERVDGCDGVVPPTIIYENDEIAASTSQDVCKFTLLEIPTTFYRVPSPVTKVAIPFSKRAKVINMKDLKQCCVNATHKKIKDGIEEDIPKHPGKENEKYEAGVASFSEVYNQLSSMVTPRNAEALSPGVALFVMLQSANDNNWRLLPQEDLTDFKVRKLAKD